MNRRAFLQKTALAAGGLTLAAGTGFNPLSTLNAAPKDKAPLFLISLAEWSFHRAINDAKTMTNLDFPVVARNKFGIDAVEYVNQFFMDKAKDMKYLAELKNRCHNEGVLSVLIMCDREGNLGDPDAKKRQQAVENHYKWVDAAKYLDCHSIRVNAATANAGTPAEQQKRAADGLRKLAEFAAKSKINVIVENHGGLSSNGEWLAGVMGLVGLPNCGTLPDFGNFRITPDQEYDRYTGVKELMPFAKGVSAKSHDFDAAGNETKTDYRQMMKIVLAAGYSGFVGIEYEGSRLPEAEGVKATKALLLKVREELANPAPVVKEPAPKPAKAEKSSAKKKS